MSRRDDTSPGLWTLCPCQRHPLNGAYGPATQLTPAGRSARTAVPQRLPPVRLVTVGWRIGSIRSGACRRRIGPAPSRTPAERGCSRWRTAPRSPAVADARTEQGDTSETVPRLRRDTTRRPRARPLPGHPARRSVRVLWPRVRGLRLRDAPRRVAQRVPPRGNGARDHAGARWGPGGAVHGRFIHARPVRCLARSRRLSVHPTWSSSPRDIIDLGRFDPPSRGSRPMRAPRPDRRCGVRAARRPRVVRLRTWKRPGTCSSRSGP